MNFQNLKLLKDIKIVLKFYFMHHFLKSFMTSYQNNFYFQGL